MGHKQVGLCAIVITIVAAGCGSENIAERIVENRIESESGQDVDIDFDDGDLSIKTDDGEFSIETDDDGNISIQGAGGSGDESFTIESDNGETVIETEDGAATFSQGADLPDDFPTDIDLPDDIEVVFAQSLDTDDGTAFSVGGTSALSPVEFADQIASNLDDAGYEREQRTSTEGGEAVIYRSAERRVQAVVTTGDEGSGFQMTVTPAAD